MAATCRKCGAPIIWIQTKKGKWMPADDGLVRYRDEKGGKDTLVAQDGQVFRCTILPDEPMYTDLPTGMARRPHWQTCPYADDFRKRGGTEEDA